MEIKIRNASVSDIPSLLDFAKHVGRFISGDEVRTWLQVDPEAMFVAEAHPGGKLIGCCCGTGFTAELGFMGLYVVLKEYRGKGVGSKLWKAAKEHLGDRNVGVRGDPNNFKRYTENDGFCHVEDYSIIYYECFGDSMPTSINSPSDIEVATYFEGNFIASSKKLRKDGSSTAEHKYHQGSRKIESDAGNFDSILTLTLPSNANVEDMSIQPEHEGNNINLMKNSKAEDILSGVVSFDKLLHKRDRSFIVRQTFSWASCRSKVALVGCKVVGYACLRKVVTENWLISPFYADTEDVAEILLFDLLREFDFSEAPKGIQIRFPDKNISCTKLAEKYGFRQNSVPRILTGFTKQCVNVDTSKVYSFHSSVFCSE